MKKKTKKKLKIILTWTALIFVTLGMLASVIAMLVNF